MLTAGTRMVCVWGRGSLGCNTESSVLISFVCSLTIKLNCIIHVLATFERVYIMLNGAATTSVILNSEYAGILFYCNVFKDDILHLH